MENQWILIQVSEDTFSHMADDLKYIGQTSFRGSTSYAIPEEFSNLIIYSSFNNNTLFPIFHARAKRVFLKNKSEYICIFELVSKVVRLNEVFAKDNLPYNSGGRINFSDEIQETQIGKLWVEIQKSPELTKWNIN